MKAWWSGLSSREQTLIAIAGALAVLFLFAQIVIAPVARWRSSVGEKAQAAESGYRLVAQAAAVAPSAGPPNGTSARNALIDTARRISINLNFVNEHPDGSVEFQAGPVDPERALALFSMLEQDFAVKVIAADISRSPEAPQQVRLQATLSR